MKHLTYTLLLCLAFILTACSDSAMVKIFDKNISKNRVPCLRLVVFPPDEALELTLHEMYNFDANCEYRLEVTQKGGIVCNSNQNAAKKTLSNFPSTYLRMDVSKEGKPLYSYYIDLRNHVSSEDIEDAFSRLKKDILKD